MFLALALWIASCDRGRDASAARPSGWHARTAWIAADRDGHALVELDEDLFVVGRRALTNPLWVRAGPGVVWAVHATLGSPHAPLALRAWGARGPEPPRAVGEVLGLEVSPDGQALVLERTATGEVRLTSHGPARPPCDLEAPQAALALALGPVGPGLALGERGWAWRTLGGSWRACSGFEKGAVLDLAPSQEGGWWTLARLPGEPESLCVEVDGDGVVREVRPVGSARRLARGTRQPWAWEPDGRDLCSPTGRALALASRGILAAVGDARGGLLVAAGGAILRLDEAGRARPGQGGFARLVDLERLDRPASPADAGN